MSSPGPEKPHDAFLSYNSQDRRAVLEVAERLKGEGLKLYLDEWELAPGRVFQPALGRGPARQQGVRGLPRAERPGAVADGRAPGRDRSRGCAIATSTSSRSCCRGRNGRGGATWRTSNS